MLTFDFEILDDDRHGFARYWKKRPATRRSLWKIGGYTVCLSMAIVFVSLLAARTVPLPKMLRITGVAGVVVAALYAHLCRNNIQTPRDNLYAPLTTNRVQVAITPQHSPSNPSSINKCTCLSIRHPRSIQPSS